MTFFNLPIAWLLYISGMVHCSGRCSSSKEIVACRSPCQLNDKTPAFLGFLADCMRPQKSPRMLVEQSHKKLSVGCQESSSPCVQGWQMLCPIWKYRILFMKQTLALRLCALSCDACAAHSGSLSPAIAPESQEVTKRPQEASWSFSF